ncbi:hypothetical protein ElyMa_001182000 [Elysia marginata]|uniref:Uncharacterized protein n=1 Tax=Elysia marginata TaxID=1093978 RepID=A0AAV4I483_9GAST|nr:hypothetical protein ElyMa_001182000 [Elysia marginata]
MILPEEGLKYIGVTMIIPEEGVKYIGVTMTIPEEGVKYIGVTVIIPEEGMKYIGVTMTMPEEVAAFISPMPLLPVYGHVVMESARQQGPREIAGISLRDVREAANCSCLLLPQVPGWCTGFLALPHKHTNALILTVLLAH